MILKRLDVGHVVRWYSRNTGIRIVFDAVVTGAVPDDKRALACFCEVVRVHDPEYASGIKVGKTVIMTHLDWAFCDDLGKKEGGKTNVAKKQDWDGAFSTANKLAEDAREAITIAKKCAETAVKKLRSVGNHGGFLEASRAWSKAAKLTSRAAKAWSVCVTLSPNEEMRDLCSIAAKEYNDAIERVVAAKDAVHKTARLSGLEVGKFDEDADEDTDEQDDDEDEDNEQDDAGGGFSPLLEF